MRTLRAGDAPAAARRPGAVPRQAVSDPREGRLRGWSIGADGRASAVGLGAGGQPVPFALRRLDRPDIRLREAVASGERVGFVVEIDPAAWQAAGATGSLTLDLALDRVATAARTVLDARALAAWVRATAGWPSPDEREVWRVLAHVAASGLLARLPRRAQAWLEAAARARGLDEALAHGDPGGRIARGARPVLRVDRSTPLAIEGWAFDASGIHPGFTLDTGRGGGAVEPDREERGWLARELDAPRSDIGFRLDVPTTVWAGADDRGACRLCLCVEGRPVQSWVLDAGALRAERDALGPLAAGDDASLHVEGRRRLALLSAHAQAMPARAGWTQDDHRALAALAEAFAAARAAPEAVLPAGASVASPPGEASATPSLRGHLEAWEGLVLQGWAMDPAAGGEVFELQCNGHVIDCLVLRTNRVDVSHALGVSHEYLGFEIQVPATVWRHADGAGACHLTLRVNGMGLTEAPLRLDTPAFERAVAHLLPGPDREIPSLARSAGMRLRMTALPLLVEHIEARGGTATLSDAARERLRALSDRLALGELVGAGSTALRPEEAEREALARQRRTWRLQRMLNAAIERRGGLSSEVLDEALDEVLADPDAEGPARIQLLMSLAPLACGQPVFERLVHELAPDVLAYHAATGDNWARSVHLAFVARAGDFESAAAQLQRVAEAPGHGWINTECVAFAVRQALGGERAGRADGPGRARVLQAFAALLDALPGDAWSRLHDQALVDTAALVLLSDGPAPEIEADRILRSILRCYALLPRFWEILDAAGVEPPARHAADLRVQAARRLHREACAVFEAVAGGDLPARRIVDALAALDGAARRGQPEARAWCRELGLLVLAHAGPAGPGERSVQADAILRALPDFVGRAEAARWQLCPGSRLRATADEATASQAPSLWPTDQCADPLHGAGDNRLRLVSPASRAAALVDAPVVVVCVVRNERAILPHFLAHYRRLGVRHFVFVDNLSDDDTRPWLAQQDDVVLYCADTDYRDSHYGVAWQQAVLAAHAAGRWALLADADEFLLYPGWEHTPLPALVEALQTQGHDAARLLMIDLYPRQALRDVDFTRSEPAASAGWMDRAPFLRWHLGGGLYSNGPTWLSALRHRLIPDSPPNAFTAQKVALLRWRPWVRLSEGLHYASGLAPAPRPLFFGHYKYHAGFRDKVVLEVERKQHFDGASEYGHYLHMVSEPGATLFDESVSVPLGDGAELDVAWGDA